MPVMAALASSASRAACSEAAGSMMARCQQHCTASRDACQRCRNVQFLHPAWHSEFADGLTRCCVHRHFEAWENRVSDHGRDGARPRLQPVTCGEIRKLPHRVPSKGQ